MKFFNIIVVLRSIIGSAWMIKREVCGRKWLWPVQKWDPRIYLQVVTKIAIKLSGSTIFRPHTNLDLSNLKSDCELRKLCVFKLLTQDIDLHRKFQIFHLTSVKILMGEKKYERSYNRTSFVRKTQDLCWLGHSSATAWDRVPSPVVSTLRYIFGRRNLLKF
jgi:hypothetical protein